MQHKKEKPSQFEPCERRTDEVKWQEALLAAGWTRIVDASSSVEPLT
jgi:hypothetical protein